MSDLISRQEVLNELSYTNWGKDWDEALAKAIIESVPAIDPVKHGKWKLVGSTTMGDSFGELAWGKMYRCSECGFVRHFIKDSEHYKFCPNCGARMDE